MSHHSDAGSGDHRHEHNAERHHRHRHWHRHEHEHNAEQRHPGPHVEARTSGSPQEIADYLEELAGAIRAGGVTIRAGERAVGLRLNGAVALDLRAAAGDGGGGRLDLSLSWQASRPPRPAAPRLRISPLQAPEPGNGPGESGHEQPVGGDSNEPGEAPF